MTEARPMPEAAMSGMQALLRASAARWRSSSVALVAVVILALFGAQAGPASGETPAAGLTIGSLASPSNFSVGDNAECEREISQGQEKPRCDAFQVTVTNAGSLPTDGNEVTVADELPMGLVVQRIRFFWSGFPGGAETDLAEFGLCSTAPVQCTFPGILGAFGLNKLAPDDRLKMVVYVTVEPDAPTVISDAASASGGNAATVAASATAANTSASPRFGVARLSSYAARSDGGPDRQAGAHPYELTTRIDLNNGFRIGPSGSVLATAVEDVKDVVVDLPLGFLGSAQAAPKCTLAQLSSEAACPPDTRVGHLLTEPVISAAVNGPIYNMVPEHGVPAEFGFQDVLHGTHVLYASVVPTSAGYVLRTTARDIPQVPLTDILATFYGNPAEKDAELRQRKLEVETGHPVQRELATTPLALFTNPSHCGAEELVTSAHMDSWQHPARSNPDGSPDFSDPRWASASTQSLPEARPAIGCDQLQFDPAMMARPDTTVADSPTGLGFDLRVPQTEDPGTLATPPLRDAAVTLPEGLVVNPAAASGLGSCSESQIGWLGGTTSNFTSEPPSCPDASKIGTVEVTSPLTAGTLLGSVYLATQNQNPFGSLLAGYIVIDDPTTGVIAKIPGRLSLDRHTGQITGIFDQNPQLPFSELKLRFFGGPHGELATPERCGTFTTTSVMAPWSAPDSGPYATPTDGFPITSGCAPGFAPSFTAGVSSPSAGGYTPFTLSFARSDDEQEPGGLTLSLPPGLVAKLAGVPLCSDAALAAAAADSGLAEQAHPSCPAASQVGTVQAGAGAGEPFFLSGRAYLTGPYKGAPYGLAVVVPALAGPFDLGTVVIRQQFQIDPHDAHVTAVSDPFPTILDATGADGQTDGFPIRLRSVDVSIDRPSFALNPTSCSPTSIAGTLISTAGATAAVSSRFQVGGCRELAFAAKFSASTSAHTSKAAGASLITRLAYPNAAQGTQANIARVKVALPIQLPSQLKTLQKACIATVFQANPAACPPESVVGHAIVHTPLLPDPLTGPAYFVSHGGEAFPTLSIVLQGDGVTVELLGTTFIRKGITSSTFNTVPDVPFSTFELALPQGRYAALGANLPAKAKGSFCAQTLKMPTELVAQNGLVVNRQTPIAVTGCPKARTRAQLLAAALKTCRRKHKGERATCERRARRRYAVKGKKKSSR
jgi:hypothetical protein